MCMLEVKAEGSPKEYKLGPENRFLIPAQTH